MPDETEDVFFVLACAIAAILICFNALAVQSQDKKIVRISGAGLFSDVVEVWLNRSACESFV